MSSSAQISESLAAGALSIAVIGPDDERRQAIASALATGEDGILRSLQRFPARFPAQFPAQLSVPITVKEFCSYPLSLNKLPEMLAQRYGVVFIDLDGDRESALDAVQSISSFNSATVMVYSAQADRDLVIRCMRAGAREFLNLPLSPGDMAGALARVPIRDPDPRPAKNTDRKLMVFLGAKGGCGVTTVATSFAVALAQDSGQSTLLIDFGFPLGDAALKLNMMCDYSTLNALEDWNRLDANFLHSLLGTHSSGLLVLSAPGEFPTTQAPIEAIERLLAVARQNFHYVVVDIGSRQDLKETSLMDESADLYLVTQVGISELRNANRLITQFFSARGQKLQIVLNRYETHALGFDDAHIATALTRPAQWKIPDEDATGRRTLNSLAPLLLEDAPISKAIRKMTGAVCGLPPPDGKKKIFSIFGGG
jgi:pilus assembly protein CpaE